jgi:hypothetical protein
VSALTHMADQNSGSGFLRTMRAVGWAFLGVRKNSEYREDLGRLNPLHLIVVALVAVALFVGGLMLLVNWVVG